MRRERDFDGQRFVRHQAAGATWRPWRLDGFECRDLGIAEATRGVARAEVARRAGAAPAQVCSHDAELLFTFVLRGTAELRCEGRAAEPLPTGTAFVVPPGLRFAVASCSDDLELLEVALPAGFQTVRHPTLAG